MAITLSGTSGGIGVIGSGTAVASTSGTSIDFTSLPAGLKRITVMFAGVSTSGSAYPIFQLGTGGVATASGYLGASTALDAASALSTNFTNGFGIYSANAANIIHGSISFTNLNSNIWVANGLFGRSSAANTSTTIGSVTLSGVLNMVRITTSNGTDTFDAGSINILYE